MRLEVSSGPPSTRERLSAAPRARWVLASVAFLALLAGFRLNFWHCADDVFFALNQKDTEALVFGRLALAHQRGLTASGCLLGFVGNHPALVTFDSVELWASGSLGFQTRAYLEEIPFSSFSPYLTHSGLQGMGFAALDALLPFASPALKANLFRTLTAALVAAGYTLLAVWIHGEFGAGPAVLFLLVPLASPWLTSFGRNLYWSLWLFLLPALGIGAVLSSSSERPNRSRRLAGAAFATLLVRFLSGYEFVTATAAIAAAPVLYYSVRDSWPIRVLRRRLLTLGAAALAALIVSLAALTLQVMAVTGSFQSAANHIRFAIGRRTRGDSQLFPPVYAAGFRAATSDVLRSYIRDRADRGAGPGPAPLGWLMSHRYGVLILWTLLASGWAAGRTAWPPTERRRRPLALAAAALLSLLGTLAWLIMFKAHSFYHLHVNPIMWHLMFLPLSASLVYVAVEDAALLVVRRVRLHAASRPRRSER